MASLDPFLSYLRQFVSFSHDEEQEMLRLLSVRRISKGEPLLAAGQQSKAFYYLIKGCVRMYYLVDGIEKNTFFYTEGQFVSSYESFVRGSPARHYISCLEDCELVIIDQQTAYHLLSFSARFEQLSRILMEEELIIYQQMLSGFVTQKAERRYAQVVEQRPDLIQRIPQYHLASFLGVSPETLSRIRARRSFS